MSSSAASAAWVRRYPMSLAEQKIDFLIIEQLPERYAAAEERGFHAIQASATDEAALKVAGIEKASYFISLLASDADNMFAVLTARELNPRLKIISRAFDAVNEKKLYKIGADLVISPYQLSSTRIVSTVLKPNVVDFFDLAIRSQKISLSIEELCISGQSPLAGKRIRDNSLRSQYNAIVVAVKRDGQMFFNPPADFEIQAGDILIVLGEKNKLLEIV